MMPKDQETIDEKEISSKDEKNILKKLDALVKKVDALEASLKTEEKEKEDSDPRDILLKRYAETIKNSLEGVLPKEKLDSMTPEELLIASELHKSMKIEKKEIGNEIKIDSENIGSYADKIKGVVFK